jgi:hypothetical protein
MGRKSRRAVLPERLDDRLPREDAVSMLVGGMWELLRQIAVSSPDGVPGATNLRALLDLTSRAWTAVGAEDGGRSELRT